ncbi:zinc finger protein GAI-ASSOCIATED FACTOR 1-like [Dioscorea cayenensis subsp. rotundata]|uniref:Protein EARLY HEADING DATE 2 n=1 Tax=Dioscorea cayennensis subsp. rotundata TaxID=55577 RepID=A0AB40BIM7_DIOCR|nr:zinc finger protein GAI-ASSOCIATED FACTOR 1-like [Dioscorea cayenensis subsp. rotundata]
MSNTSEDESQQPFLPSVTAKPDTSSINPPSKKRRSLPGNPDPDAEVVALSPRTLLATNRYICEVCHKGFQRDQNLQLHRRGHNLPWKLKQRTSTEVKKKVYVCPEVTCVHHNPSRALGDLTGIKKHFSRKHGEKKWKCDKCSKKYAVQSDWKAHAKICGTKEYRCDCGTIFSRKDSFVTHRAFCDALAEENYRTNHGLASMVGSLQSQTQDLCSHSMPSLHSSSIDTMMNSTSSDHNSNNPHSLSLNNPLMANTSDMIFNPSAMRNSGLQLGGMNTNMMSSGGSSSSLRMSIGSSYMSATALLQKAAEMGAKVSDNSISPILLRGFTGYSSSSKSLVSMQEPVNPFSTAVADTNAYVGNNPSTTTDHHHHHHAYNSVNAENHTSMVGLEAQLIRRNTSNTTTSSHEEMGERRDGRMTQDFLGLGPAGNARINSDHGYVENSVGLRYSNEHQQNQEEMMYTGYHHSMSQGQQPTLAKPMWDF